MTALQYFTGFALFVLALLSGYVIGHRHGAGDAMWLAKHALGELKRDLVSGDRQ